MKPAPFEYHAPNSIDEALFILHNSGGDAKILAGGQSLVPAMNFRVVQPSVLIDLNRVSALGYIHEENDQLKIGSMTRERHLEFNESVIKRTPLLHEAAPHIAHPQIRNRGTIGGSIVNADPAAELPVLMLASQARLKARNASSERWIDAQDFFVGMFTTALEPDEILVEIEIPFMPPRTGWSFLGGLATTSPVAVSTTATTYTFVVVESGGTWYRARTGTDWGPWISLGGVLAYR